MRPTSRVTRFPGPPVAGPHTPNRRALETRLPAFAGGDSQSQEENPLLSRGEFFLSAARYISVKPVSVKTFFGFCTFVSRVFWYVWESSRYRYTQYIVGPAAHCPYIL